MMAEKSWYFNTVWEFFMIIFNSTLFCRVGHISKKWFKYFTPLPAPARLTNISNRLLQDTCPWSLEHRSTLMNSASMTELKLVCPVTTKLSTSCKIFGFFKKIYQIICDDAELGGLIWFGKIYQLYIWRTYIYHLRNRAMSVYVPVCS